MSEPLRQHLPEFFDSRMRVVAGLSAVPGVWFDRCDECAACKEMA